MKAITICQPWAHLIAAGVKRIENRTWRTSYRGPIAIHAGKSKRHAKAFAKDPDAFFARYGILPPAIGDLAFGAVIAIARISDCFQLEDLSSGWRGHPFAEGPWCWILHDIRRLPTPLPMTGQLSLWPVSDAIITRALAA